MSDTEELFRLRDRCHRLATGHAALRARVEQLERWVLKYEPLVEDLRDSEQLARAVADKMRETQTNSLTKVQRRVAICGAVVGFVALIVNLAQGFLH